MPPAKVCPPERLQKRPLPAIRIRPDDVFIVSYPRSGNTWVRFLIANLLAPDEKITFRNIENYVPSIYKSADTLDTRGGRRYIKSHNPCYELYPKLIYVYRDGRDALVPTTTTPRERTFSLEHSKTSFSPLSLNSLHLGKNTSHALGSLPPNIQIAF